MVHAPVTIFVLLGAIAVLSFARFRKRPAEDRRTYARWFREGLRALPAGDAVSKARRILADWIALRYPSWTRWIFIAFAGSLVFQAGLGFVFEIFSPRGLFGLPLLGHMLGGGIFALGLCGILLWRGRAYRLDENMPALFDGHLRLIRRAASPTYARKIVFWLLAGFGLVQVATAAGSMLPVFTFETQKALLEIHRLGALGVAVSAALFADLTFIPRRRT